MIGKETEFNWDESIMISGRKYSSGIVINDETVLEDVKDLIETQIIKAKKEISIQQKEKDDFEFEKEEMEELKYLFQKHFSLKNPISQIWVGYENLPSFIEDGNRYIEFMQKSIQEDIGIRKDRIDGRITNIKRICLENVALILKTDGNRKPKHNAEIILSINDLEIDIKRKLEKEQIGSYKLLKKFPYNIYE